MYVHICLIGFGVLCVGWLTILLCIFQSFDVVAIHCTLRDGEIESMLCLDVLSGALPLPFSLVLFVCFVSSLCVVWLVGSKMCDVTSLHLDVMILDFMFCLLIFGFHFHTENRP